MILKPSLIVTLGRHSTSYIFSKVNVKVQRITDVRGRIYRKHLLNLPVRVIPTLHPAAALYNPKYRSILEEDFQRIKIEKNSFDSA